MKRGAIPWVVLSVLLFLGYPGSYAALRLTHVLVHSSFWTSEEGFHGHHIHDLEGRPGLLTLYRPLITVELLVQRRCQP